MQVSAVNFLFNFCGRKGVPQRKNEDTPQGIDYSSVNTLDLHRDRTIAEISIAAKNGEDISADRNKLICSRISKAMADAGLFVSEYPEYNLDDVTQDLILFIVHATDYEIKSGKHIFGPDYVNLRNNYFEKLTKKLDRDLIIQEKLKADPSTFEWEEDFLNAEQNKVIASVLETLKPREQEMIKLRFGFGDDVEHTLLSIGKIYNVNKQRVGQILARALWQLRHPSRSRVLKDIYKD